MDHPGTWPKHAVQVAAVAALLCTFAFAESGSASRAVPESPQSGSGKASSSSHRSAKGSRHSPSAKAHSSVAGKSRKTSSHTASRKSRKSRKSYRRGQQKIDGDRTLEIQQALIQQHYLSGPPSGKWDASTEEALRRYQADNGWQNKTVPDSRALIKLGLGPSHDHLLNPESAMTTAPESQNPASPKPVTGPAPETPASNQPN